MSEPIRVGDLVVVTRACCIQSSCLGDIFKVAEIKFNRTACAACNFPIDCVHAAAIKSFQAGVPLSWLRRIPPLSELESSETKQEIEA